MSPLEYVSWRRARLIAERTAPNAQGRLARNLRVTLTDSVAGSADGDIALVFRSAADVAALTQRAIRHRAPQPGVADAETTKLTHVDFASPDLPWRYTPRGAEPDDPARLRPWLALIVGDADEIRLDGATAVIAARLLAMPYHLLGRSWQWAHVHSPVGDPEPDHGTPGPQRLSRLLSPRTDLRPLTGYTAVLVPTFNAAGQDMWDPNGVVRNGGAPLPVLSSWSFTTGEGGDFETLAAQLTMPPAADLGKATLRYPPALAPAGALDVDVRGALASLQEARPGDDSALDGAARAMADWVLGVAADPQLLGLPEYGRPWVASPSEQASGWVAQLREDARMRIHAGTGAWTGVEAQDELMAAAVDQAGSLLAAAGKIARTAAGLMAAAVHWDRALPADPVERLTVLGALAPRLPVTGSSGTVADVVTGPGSTLGQGIFSGAGARLLGRPSRTRDASAPGPADTLGAINAAPVPDGDSRERLINLWEEVHPDGRELFELVEAALALLTGGHAHEAAEILGHRYFGCEDLLERVLSALRVSDWDEAARRLTQPDAAALAYGPAQTPILRCLFGCAHDGDDQRGRCAALIALLRIPAPQVLHPVSLERLGAAIAGTVDPRGPRAPARLRLSEEIHGLPVDSLAPPRYPLGLDFPTWTLLRRYAPDWLLPGAQRIPEHTITALRTNPAFIDAFLVGLNTQFLSEVRWRGLPVDRWGTPLRMFFGPVDPATGKRRGDIVPIEEWDPATPLGANQHQDVPPGPDPTAPAERLVVLFHTPLFRRYPATLVYLHRATGDEELDQASLVSALQPETGLSPVFTGTITPDLVFFVFGIAPSDLSDYYLVLDEPEAELRFRAEPGYGADLSSAAVAATLTDRHTRVAISGAHLETQGGMP